MTQPAAERVRVMIVDDEKTQCLSAGGLLRRFGYAVDWEVDLERAEERIPRERPDILLLDVEFPGDRHGGIHLLQRLRRAGQLQPAIFLSHIEKIQAVVEASRQGMVTYLGKDADEDEVRAALREAESALPLAFDPALPAAQQMIGGSPALRETLRLCEVYGPETDTPVLVTGESGVGKTLVAHALHEAAFAPGRRLLTVLCPSLSPSIADSELFGHARGAFTGAVRDHDGYFQAADGGTLFLDEIGDLPLEVQLKLLRVLDGGEFNVVGRVAPGRSTARVVCATNRDIPGMIRRGEFRADLWNRIQGLRIHVPPLRERREDIAPLACYFLTRMVAKRPEKPRVLSPEALRVLEAFPWRTGNVRDLQSTVQRAFLHSTQVSLEAWQIEQALPEAELGEDGPAPGGAVAAAPGETLLPARVEEVPPWRDYKAAKEREYFERVVELAGGNITRAAELAGVDRKKVHEVRRWG